MAVNFEVRTDNSGRMLGFSMPDSEELIPTVEFGQSYAGERITHNKDEFDIDGHGNLIHPSVEVPDPVRLGYGVLLGSGVEFSDKKDQLPSHIGNSTLVPGNTRFGDGLSVANHVIIRASSIGSGNAIGDHTRIGEDSSTGSNVALFPSVKIGDRAVIGSDTMLKRNVRIPDDARIGSGVFMAHNVRLKPTPYARSGASMFVADGVRIETSGRKITADVRSSILAND